MGRSPSWVQQNSWVMKCHAQAETVLNRRLAAVHQRRGLERFKSHVGNLPAIGLEFLDNPTRHFH
jgi:hypothetical protein